MSLCRSWDLGMTQKGGWHLGVACKIMSPWPTRIGLGGAPAPCEGGRHWVKTRHQRDVDSRELPLRDSQKTHRQDLRGGSHLTRVAVQNGTRILGALL